MNNDSIVEKLYDAGRAVVLGTTVYGATLLGGCASTPEVSPNYVASMKRTPFYNKVKTEVGEDAVVLNEREARAIGLVREVSLILDGVEGEQVYVFKKDGVVLYTPRPQDEELHSDDLEYSVGVEGDDSRFVTTDVLDAEGLETFVRRSDARQEAHASLDYRTQREKSAEDLSKRAEEIRGAHSDHTERKESYTGGVTSRFPNRVDNYEVRVLPGGIVKLDDLAKAAGPRNGGISYLNRALRNAKGITKAKADNPEGYLAYQIPGWDTDSDGTISEKELRESVDRFGGLGVLLYISNDGTILARHEVTAVEDRKDGLAEALKRAQEQNKLVLPSSLKKSGESKVEPETLEVPGVEPVDDSNPELPKVDSEETLEVPGVEPVDDTKPEETPELPKSSPSKEDSKEEKDELPKSSPRKEEKDESRAGYFPWVMLAGVSAAIIGIGGYLVLRKKDSSPAEPDPNQATNSPSGVEQIVVAEGSSPQDGAEEKSAEEEVREILGIHNGDDNNSASENRDDLSGLDGTFGDDDEKDSPREGDKPTQ